MITDLGSIGGTLLVPTAINDLGQIVGWSSFLHDSIRAFSWQQGKIIKLSVIPGDKISMANAINSKGQIVGTSSRAGGASHAVLWDKGGVVSLGVIGSGKLSGGSVQAINDVGQIIVNKITYPDGSEASRLHPAVQTQQVLVCTLKSITDGRPVGHNAVIGLGINNSGAVVGSHFDAVRHSLSGYLWKDGVFTDLGDFLPSGINAGGVIVGTRREGKLGTSTAALWKDGTVTLLRAPSAYRTEGTAISDKEEIIGATDLVADFSAPHKALLWKNNNSVDLSSSLLPKGEWTMLQPTAINNLGQIVGFGLHKGKATAFLMTPIAPTAAAH